MDNSASNMNVPAPLSNWGDIPFSPTALRLISAVEFRTTNAKGSSVIRVPHWNLEIFNVGGLEINPDYSGWHPCSPGTGVLYAPGTGYQERLMTRSRQCVSICIFFDATCNLQPFLPTPFAFIQDEHRLLEPLLGSMLLTQGGGPAALLAATASFYQTISLLFSAKRQKDTLAIFPQNPAIPDLILSVHQYLHQHLSEPIRIRDIAEKVGMSESGLAHAYRRITGCKLMSTLRGFRVEAAKARLLRGEMTLDAIAAQTGFADGFHLSRTFKHYVGTSPRDFVRSSKMRPFASIANSSTPPQRRP